MLEIALCIGKIDINDAYWCLVISNLELIRAGNGKIRLRRLSRVHQKDTIKTTVSRKEKTRAREAPTARMCTNQQYQVKRRQGLGRLQSDLYHSSTF